jgi:putative membrane protein
MAAGLGILTLLAAAPAAAADDANGNVEIVNTETVQVYMSPDGKVDTKRVYEQLALTGTGKVDLANPIATAGLRNLDGFGGFEVKDGRQLIRTKVEGEKKLRSVSDFKGRLPLDIDVTYQLDGREVKPGGLVGKSGTLEVTFLVANVTGEMRDVVVPDGKGGTVTKSMDVPIPMVGSLTTTAPENFANVASKQANLAGDGKGGTKLSFTMTLFPPIGSTTATFGYTADVTDGVVPRVDVSALPVNPLESPTFASAATSYQGGADTGAKLTDGATEIDANLLKLRDGAAELLAGLIKLRDGAGELSSGLNDEAVPGSKKLADGAGELSSGLLRLDDGAGKLADGSKKLSGGTEAALAGGKKLTTGLGQISGGLGQLAGQLPNANAGITKLQAGVDTLIAGMGTASKKDTILYGLNALSVGLGASSTPDTLISGATLLKGGLHVLAHGDGTQENPGLDGAKAGVDGMKSQLDPKLSAGGELAQLIDALNDLSNNNPGCSADATCKGRTTALADKVAASKADLQKLSGGLGGVSGGLGKAIGAIDRGFIPGTQKLLDGLNTALTGVTRLQAGAEDVKIGMGQVRGGLNELAVGLTAALAGINKLDGGAGDAYSGSKALTDGVAKLDAGANQLSDGAGQLSDGAGTANDGGTQLAAGARQLSVGLQDAGEGSSLVLGGLNKAADSAPALPEGAQRLSNEGTRKLIAAGQATASSYGDMVAVIKAGGQRGSAEKMAYGAPDGAMGLTAYSYIIKGEDGEGGRNMTRALGGLALFGAAGGLFLLRRRLPF